MRVELIASGAALLLAACGGDRGANLTNNVATATTDVGMSGRMSGAQNQVMSLPEGQRNGVLIRAIRDAGLTCQHVERSELSPASSRMPVYMATCEDGAVYAVAVQDNGTAAVEPVMPARGR